MFLSQHPIKQPLPPPARRSGGVQGPPTSSSSQNKTPGVSPWNPLHHLHVRPASETQGEKKGRACQNTFHYYLPDEQKLACAATLTRLEALRYFPTVPNGST